MFEQALDERGLRGDQLLGGLGGRQPRRTVDLGERLPAPGPRWPLHLERRGPQAAGIEVATRTPGMHDLAALLAHLAEVDQLTQRRALPELLLELAQRAGLGFLALVV